MPNVAAHRGELLVNGAAVEGAAGGGQGLPGAPPLSSFAIPGGGYAVQPGDVLTLHLAASSTHNPAQRGPPAPSQGPSPPWFYFTPHLCLIGAPIPIPLPR